jgi:(E)-2-((N-methylformamido)methylene)succinate hydrolase
MTAATSTLERRVANGVAYHVGGEGEPLVLVHGLAGGAGNWCEVVPEAVERYRVLAVDLPGHAGSEPLPRGATVDDFADAVASVLDAEGITEALVAGHSFGGLVALRLAHRRPELVRALLLVSPAGISTARRVVAAVVAATTTLKPGRAVAPFRHRWAGRAWYRRALFRPWFVADADALPERAVHGLLEAHPLHASTRIAGRAMVADDPRRDLAVTCPALVLWGSHDAQLPLDDAFEYARRLRAPLRIVADCGHLVIVERPRAVLDALAALG